MAEGIGIAERERGEVGGVDADDGEIELAVPRDDFGGVEDLAVEELDGDGTCLADNVEAGGDESIGAEDEACADAVGLSVASVVGDDDH